MCGVLVEFVSYAASGGVVLRVIRFCFDFLASHGHMRIDGGSAFLGDFCPPMWLHAC